MAESSEAEKEFEKELRWIIDTQNTSSWSDKMQMINEEFISMKDAKIERLNNTITDLQESKEVLSTSFGVLKIASIENERLKQLLDRAQEYLVDLRGEWSWRKDEPRNRNAKIYSELDSFIKQIVKAANQEEPNDG